MAATCHRALLAPTSCEAAPTVTVIGLVLIGQPGKRRAVWRAFACDVHAEELRGARPLLPKDREILETRRQRRRTQLAGKRWSGEAEGPLAMGCAADDLLARAEAWGLASFE